MQTPESATLVCFALKEEAAAFRKKTADRNDVSVLISGIGRANTEKSVRNFLATHQPPRVFTCGFAGGLNPKLRIGDVIYSTDDPALRKRLAASGALAATFHCAPRVATTAMEKTELRQSTGADAVEMESDAIQILCRERNIPCATIRVISDTADENMPLDFNLLSNPDMSLNFGKLAIAITKSPGKIPALMRLQKNTRLAAERLAETLVRLLASDAA